MSACCIITSYINSVTSVGQIRFLQVDSNEMRKLIQSAPGTGWSDRQTKISSWLPARDMLADRRGCMHTFKLFSIELKRTLLVSLTSLTRRLTSPTMRQPAKAEVRSSIHQLNWQRMHQWQSAYHDDTKDTAPIGTNINSNSNDLYVGKSITLACIYITNENTNTSLVILKLVAVFPERSSARSSTW